MSSMATFRKTEGGRYREKKERREIRAGKEGGTERLPFKSPNFVVATVMGEGMCSGPGTGLEN